MPAVVVRDPLDVSLSCAFMHIKAKRDVENCSFFSMLKALIEGQRVVFCGSALFADVSDAAQECGRSGGALFLAPAGIVGRRLVALRPCVCGDRS